MIGCKLFVILILISLLAVDATNKKYNVVFLLADDLGFADLGYNEAKTDVKSPNIDKLAKSGVRFDESYTMPICTPSRAALMTGYQPYKYGLQHAVIKAPDPGYLSLKYKTLGDMMQKEGYKTHLVGKWHLGFCNEKYTPLKRGFDTFHGFYVGQEHYFSHMDSESNTTGSYLSGYDYRNMKTVDRTKKGKYGTFVVADKTIELIEQSKSDDPFFMYVSFQAPHTPLSAPDKYLNMFKGSQYEKCSNGTCTSTTRRKYLASIAAMDYAVGEIVAALKKKSILDDTIIIFSGDNGGDTWNGASNSPYKGYKGEITEGGTRAKTFVYGKVFENNTALKSYQKGIFHILDWAPTLLQMTGSKNIDKKMDGMGHWSELLSGKKFKRTKFFYNLDEIWKFYAYRDGNYKVSLTSTGGWKMFNLKTDSTEKVNIAAKMPYKFMKMKRIMQIEMNKTVSAMAQYSVPKADPALYGGTWSSGWC